jgi:hypothetical protein
MSVASHSPIDRSVLGCIVTGYAKGGTTLLKDLLVQTTDMQSGFEGGMLLEPSPARGIPEPHCRNLIDAWRPAADFLDRYRGCATFEDGYRLLRDSAAVLPDRTSPLLDKTPEYLVCLADVVRRAPGTPLVAVLRDPLHVVVSWVQLGNPLSDAIAWVHAATESLVSVVSSHGRRLPCYIVSLAELVAEPDATLAPLQVWLGRWPRRMDRARDCGMPYTAGGRDRMPRGIEIDRHDVTSRCDPATLERIRRELRRAVPAASWIASLRSGPAADIAGPFVRAA